MTYDNIVKRQASIIFISVILMVILIIGGSYAMFLKVDSSKETQVIKSGNLSIVYTTDTENLTSLSEPLDSGDGMDLKGYTFSVNNKANSDLTRNLKYSYSIYLINKSTNAVPAEYILFSLDNSTPATLASLTPIDGKYTLKTNLELAAGATNSHNIKMWIAADAPDTIVGKSNSFDILIDGEAIE